MPNDSKQNGDDEQQFIALRLLQRWIKRIPNSLSKALFLFLAIGAGLGLVLAISSWTVTWFRNRPIPPKVWPAKRFEQAGITATLETEWNDGIHCKLRIEPSELIQSEGFGRLLSENRYQKVTINLYNSTRFRIWSSDNYLYTFTRFQSNEGKTHGAIKEDCLEGLPRDLYSKVDSWNVSTDLPSLPIPDSTGDHKAAAETGSSGLPQTTQNNSKPSRPLKTSPEGDDVVSGYSVVQSNLETSGGLTFFIYKDGERDNAIMWGGQSAHIHYRCEANSVCTLTRTGIPVVLHARRRQ